MSERLPEEKAAQWRELLQKRKRDEVHPNPLDVEDTGEETCAICQCGRSILDDRGVCLLCTVYLLAGDRSKIHIINLSDIPDKPERQKPDGRCFFELCLVEVGAGFMCQEHFEMLPRWMHLELDRLDGVPKDSREWINTTDAAEVMVAEASLKLSTGRSYGIAEVIAKIASEKGSPCARCDFYATGESLGLVMEAMDDHTEAAHTGEEEGAKEGKSNGAV